MKIRLLLLALLCFVASWGQLSEGFESGLPTAYTATTSYNLGSGTWTGQANGVIRGTTGIKSGMYTLQIRSQTGAQATTPNLTTGVGTVTFWASASTASGSVQVNYSTDGGGTWSAATGSPFSLNTTVAQFVATVNSGAPSILIQFYRTAATVYIDDVNITSYVSGITTRQNGNWNDTNTWTGFVVPTDSQNAIINHNVTLDANVTRNTGTATTINTIGSLNTSTNTYTNNGTTTVNGTFQLDGGGWATGSGTFNYSNTTGTLNFNDSASYGVNNSDVFWPTTNGPYNVNVLQNGITLNAGANRVVNGLFTTANAGAFSVSFPSATLTLNGTCRINSGGAFGSAPIFGNSSTLIYNSGGDYGRGLEWSYNGVGTIGTTAGYPNHVQLSGNTTLDYLKTTFNAVVGIKAMAGNLTIDSGSTLNMDYNTTPHISTGGALIVAGNISNSGTLILGYASGDDLKLKGNFTNTGTFNGNNRAIFFTKTGTQTVSSTTPLTIPYVVFQPVSGSTTVQLLSNLTVSAPATGNAIAFSSASDVFDLNSNSLTIGTSGFANVISGSGTFKGTTTSNMTLYGTGSIGTLRFTTGSQNLGTFTVDRTTGTEACVMGTALTVNTTMNLTAGIIDLDASTFTLNASTVLTGASSNNYFIADNVSGGILRKGYTTTGSFTFPIGEKTGTTEYSPATINLTAGAGMSATSYLGVSVNDSKHLSLNAPTDFISRYWAVTKSGTINTPTYTFTGTYLPVDINGTETNSLVQQWDGSNWTTTGIAVSSNTLTYTNATVLPATNHFCAGNREQEINIKNGGTNYLTGSTYNFGSVAAGLTSTYTFTIENQGNANLILYSNTAVAAPFSITTPLSYNVTLSSAGTITFTIQFAPLAAGAFSGSITFANNDSDESSYTINFTGTGTVSNLSDIFKVNLSEPATIPSTTIGTISSITDGIEAWRFYLRDGGSTLNDTDLLPTTMTDLIISQSAGDAIGNWDESIQDIVLVNLTTSAIISHGVVTSNQIQFNGINVVAVDNAQVLLALRITLKCPLGVGAIDGEDFGFNISNSNVVFASSGSGKASFSVQTSTNNRNAISVIATKLLFTTQPITTGVNVAMGNVVVTATDDCGNKDLQFTNAVSLTSTGTMNAIGPINAVAGVATFSGILHTVIGIDYNLIASASVFTPVASTLFDISVVTVLNPGDLAVLAVNTSIVTGGTDQISFVCFRDLLPGTNLLLTDNGYERQFANLWGGTEGVISITRTGSILPKGTIITIETTTPNVTSGSHYEVYTCGAIDSNWTKSAVNCSCGGGFNLNADDDIYFMQGGVWTNNTAHTSTYTGNILYAWTESGWDASPGGGSQSTKWSTLYPGMECFNTIAPSGNAKVKFDDPIDPDFSTTTNGRFDWIALINDQSNWDTYSDNTLYDAGGYNYKGGCTLVTLATSLNINGRWTGRTDTNWFNCSNWDTLIVPNATTDVIIPDTTYDRQATVDATAPYANYLNYIAKAKNLTITGEKVEIVGNTNNKLEVYGDLLIDTGTGILDMNGGTATDGQLYLYGNWTNNVGNDAFEEGNGIVQFVGTAPQIINNVAPLGTEIFKNVILNNNFNTAISNDLYVSGDLTLNTAKTLNIDSDGYVTANNKLTSNGNIVIQNNGQLIQANDSDTNAGTYSGTTFEVKRNFTAKHYDYIYWGSPTKLFPVASLPTSHKYQWDTTFNNTLNGTQGNWVAPTTTDMVEGKGYIARASNGSSTAITAPFSFYGKPNNGLITVPISRGNYTGLPYDAEPSNPNNALTTQWDDNWNLLGNPYPSAIKVLDFLTANTNIEGFVNVWTHSTLPVSITDPFYYNFKYNYSTTDFITYNGTGIVSGPSGLIFDGYLASGQGFFVLMSDGSAATSSIFFNNSMRSDIPNKQNYINSQFYKNSNNNQEGKNRIWLDLIAENGQIDRTLVGYVPEATNNKDRLFDAVTKASGLKLYSFSEDIPLQPLCIQGKALPFDDEDSIRLGFSANANGSYKIAIGTVDGLFTKENQNIYLEDKLMSTIHDLRQSPYQFTTEKGIFDERFILRYTESSFLDVNNFSTTNQLIISTNHGQITLNSKSETINQIQVFDMLGRKIYDKQHLNALSYTISNIAKDQVLIVKVKLNNGDTVSNKIIVK